MTSLLSLLSSSALILVSCGLNNHTLELMLQEDSGFGPLLSLCQFLFVVAAGGVAQLEWRSRGAAVTRLRFRTRTIPLWFHALVALVFFSTQMLNNVAYGLGVSQPLTLCLRSGGLAVTFLLGRTFFSQSYSARQFAAVVAIVLGVALTVVADSTVNLCRDCSFGDTLAAAFAALPTPSSTTSPAERSTGNWLLGVATLLVALVMSAVMGHLQDAAYSRWKRSPNEVMFYSHLLSLPAFFFVGGELSRSISRWTLSEPLLLWGASLGPRMWLFLLANVVTQWWCVRSVYAMTGRYGTLTCTVVLTLRKFLSLLGSVYFFENEWSPLHWVGTVLVFSGVIAYAGIAGAAASTRTRARARVRLLAADPQKKKS